MVFPVVLSPALFLAAALAASILFSMIVSGLAIALVRWDGGTLPAALSRGGVAFGGTLTLCCVVIAILVGITR
ncbi:hypothetical protein OG851_43095 (plasmid) [Streptomyces sp. NBC_00161]|uniref:hypothetical protein n=1 Tax=Streptomyces sp. NBC_00161 TaxID=2975671 RepID=UPI0032556FE7